MSARGKHNGNCRCDGQKHLVTLANPRTRQREDTGDSKWRLKQCTHEHQPTAVLRVTCPLQ
ncbi:hypothetical protein EMIT0111MI5_230088 [Burkholderia sp. IT-111MI5]